MSDDNVVHLPFRRGPGGGGPYDGIGERIAKVEARVDEIARRIEALDHRLSRIDDKLGRLPSKEFLATTVIAVGGISLAAALAFAALTFNVADYAAKTTQQAEQAKPSPPSPTAQQPIVIMMPSVAPSPPSVARPQQDIAPAAPKTATPP